MNRDELLHEIRLIKYRMLSEPLSPLETARLITALMALYESVVALDTPKAA